jgi:methylated-DNA-[protein]-cysteine S-methyltransferase
MTNYTHTMPSPVGPLRIAVDARGAVCRIDFLGDDGRPATPAPGDRDDAGRCAHVVRQLEDYFAGRRTTFELDLAPQGTDFQRAVWRALQAIPFGGTASYEQQARRLGNAKAMRAVGAANGRNPIPIVVPCHRVIGKDGGLVGFGGGLPRKQWLLQHEQRVLAAVRPD